MWARLFLMPRYVARELGIPAVVGCGNALCTQNGDRVRVDGSVGIVELK